MRTRLAWANVASSGRGGGGRMARRANGHATTTSATTTIAWESRCLGSTTPEYIVGVTSASRAERYPDRAEIARYGTGHAHARAHCRLCTLPPRPRRVRDVAGGGPRERGVG